MTDTERLDWLDKQDGAALVSDDAGHWAVTFNGMQRVPSAPPEGIESFFWIEKEEWHYSVRDAIDRARADEEKRIGKRYDKENGSRAG